MCEQADNREVRARWTRVWDAIHVVCDEEEIPFFVSDEASFFDVCSLAEGEIAQRLATGYAATVAPADLRQPIWRLVDRIDELRQAKK